MNVIRQRCLILCYAGIVLVMLAGLALYTALRRTSDGAETAPKLHLVTRAEWGAEPPRIDADLYTYPEPLRAVLHGIVIHHTAFESDSPLFIQHYHMHTRKYNDLAYHFVIANDGTLYEGRSLIYRGAHAKGHNDGTIGIVVSGDLNQRPLHEAQRRTLYALCQDLCRRFDIQTLGGHRDFCGYFYTECPGAKMNDEIDFLCSMLGIQRHKPAE